jgi:hypothetical protein
MHRLIQASFASDPPCNHGLALPLGLGNLVLPLLEK